MEVSGVPHVLQNIFLLVQQKKNSVNDDRIFIFEWSISLQKGNLRATLCSGVRDTVTGSPIFVVATRSL